MFRFLNSGRIVFFASVAAATAADDYSVGFEERAASFSSSLFKIRAAWLWLSNLG